MRYEEAEGNVILSASPTMNLVGTWEDGGTKFQLRARFTLGAGALRDVREVGDRCVQQDRVRRPRRR